MKYPYFGLWALLAVALIVFTGVSYFMRNTDEQSALIKPAPIYSELTKPLTSTEVVDSNVIDATTSARTEKATVVTKQSESGAIAHNEGTAETINKQATAEIVNAPRDTTSKNILFIGDSMLEGLSPRLAAYAKKNGHKLNSVIWYSSTTEIWGRCDSLRYFIRKFKPDYIFISLGANELFVSNIIEKRTKYTQRLLSQVGDIPYVWIGPPNWKADTGINDMIAQNTKKGCFFLTNGMKFNRKKDGAHPTAESAIVWMDSVVRWMNHHAAHPIMLDLPDEQKSRANSVTTLQPVR